MNEQHHPSAPRRGRRPGRRFLALASDALYVGEPPRSLESTSIPDPETVVELVAAAVSLRDEPECISGAILDSYGRDAVFFQSVRHAQAVEGAVEARKLLPHGRRVLDAAARAKAQHRTDLRGDLRALEQALERAARGIQVRIVERDDGFTRRELVAEPTLSVAALDRLLRVEAALDRAPDLEVIAA